MGTTGALGTGCRTIRTGRGENRAEGCSTGASLALNELPIAAHRTPALKVKSRAADRNIVAKSLDRLACSREGAAILVGACAACGAGLALAGMYLLARFWIDPWLDALPPGEQDWDLVRPEGVLVATATILFGPAVAVLAAWVGVKCARSYWNLAADRPGGGRFGALACAFGLLSFGTIDALGTGGALVMVAIGVGLAGFIATISVRRESPNAR